MFDQLFTPSSRPGVDVRVYNPTSAITGQGYQQWRKPQGVSMVCMIAIGGGGGGGGGFTRVANADGGGGAGGACSGLARFIVPAILLPDVLYVQVGSGGKGSSGSGVAGTAGTNSFILTSKTAVLPNIVCYSGVNVPGGGGAGTGSAGGTGGTVPTIAVTQPWNACGQWFATVGIVGGAGGAHTGAAGTTITAWALIPMSPGAGGGGSTGTDNAGGGQTATALLDIGSQGYFPTTAGILAPGGVANGGMGSSGVERITPFFNTGGGGGGTDNDAVGGTGGSGGIGCGGGGGGAGATGGGGGNGGDGLVVIISW